MTPEFKYAIISTSVDGLRLTSRFTNASSAHDWARHLQEENVRFEIFLLPTLGDSINQVTLSIKELKARAGSEGNKKRKKR